MVEQIPPQDSLGECIHRTYHGLKPKLISKKKSVLTSTAANVDNMLTQGFVASIQTPLKTSSTDSKDVGIFVNELQPLASLQQTFKRSSTAPNCIAVNETHVFAAQAEKAAVHVYSRGKGRHEATVPFNEKVTSLVLAASGLVLLLGTEGGQIMAWELATGRLSSASHAHLQAVTCLAVDPTSNFVLSGSRDANVLVWSLSDILSFTSSDGSGQANKSPIRSLSNQRGAITSVSAGHGHGSSNIVASASEDQSVMIWDYATGSALRTYLLRSIPRALVLDNSDRGFYTTYDDGSVQLVDFYEDGHLVSSMYDERVVTPVQPGDSHLWKAEGQELGDGVSLALSWDSTRLLSGHRSGKIASWDVSKGSFAAITSILPGSVSSIITLPVDNFPETKACGIRTTEIVKPRMMSMDVASGIPGTYSVSSQLGEKHTATRFRATRSSNHRQPSSFQHALAQSAFPEDVLKSGQVELNSRNSTGTSNGASDTHVESANGSQDLKELKELKLQNQSLLEQVAHLQKLQKASFVQLREKTVTIGALVKEQEQLADMARRERG